MRDYPPGLPADEFVGNLVVDGFWSRDRKLESSGGGAPQIDYLKIAMWIIGAVVPWAGFAVLLLTP